MPEALRKREAGRNIEGPGVYSMGIRPAPPKKTLISLAKPVDLEILKEARLGAINELNKGLELARATEMEENSPQAKTREVIESALDQLRQRMDYVQALRLLDSLGPLHQLSHHQLRAFVNAKKVIECFKSNNSGVRIQVISDDGVPQPLIEQQPTPVRGVEIISLESWN